MVATESDSTLQRGDDAPGFELPGTDGDTHRLADYADHSAVLVVFTCNHCPYAKAKIGTLNAITAEYDEVAVVGVNPNDAEEYPEDSFDRMRDVVADGTVRYDAYLRDESQDVARAYGAVCTPDPFLLRPTDGEFEVAYHGRLDDATNPDDEPSGEPGFEVRQAIDDVLAGRDVSVEERPSRGCSIKWRED